MSDHNLGDPAVGGHDPVEQQPYEPLALGGIVLASPQFAEVREQIDAALPIDVLDRPGLGELTGELGFAAQVLIAGVIAEFVEVTGALELPPDLLGRRANGGALGVVALGLAEPEDLQAFPVAGDLEGLDELADLVINRLREREWLIAGVPVHPVRAGVARAIASTTGADSAQPPAADPAVDRATQQVDPLRGVGAVLDNGSLFPDRTCLLPQLARDDRFEVAAYGLFIDYAAAGGDVPGVGGVAEHLADSVLRPRLSAATARALGVEPVGDRAVGLGAACVPHIDRQYDRRLLGVVDGVASVLGGGAHQPERKHADDVALRLLFAEAVGDPECDPEALVLVDDLAHPFGQEGAGVVGIAELLADELNRDPQPLAQQLLELAGFHRVAREAGGVEGDHCLKLVLDCVIDQTLEVAAFGGVSARDVVHVPLCDRVPVRGCVLLDRVALSVG